MGVSNISENNVQPAQNSQQTYNSPSDNNQSNNGAQQNNQSSDNKPQNNNPSPPVTTAKPAVTNPPTTTPKPQTEPPEDIIEDTTSLQSVLNYVNSLGRTTDEYYNIGAGLGHNGSDYGKAEAVYNWIRGNVSGNCQVFSAATNWFCQYHLTHFIRTRIMQRERYDHSRAFFELPEAAHRWRCRFFC
jgi:hypothetical protein